MKINLVLFQPEGSAWNLVNSYLEVIESLRWGFESLGYDCTFRRNVIDTSSLNILFGFVGALNSGNVFPPGTIVYNMEQYAAVDPKTMPNLAIIAKNFQVWDYCEANIAWWNRHQPKYHPYFAPISYAPSLTRIQIQANEDIDMLYIGSLNQDRAEKLVAFGARSFSGQNSLVALSGIWGQQRDDFIARSKVLINLSNPTTYQRIFEIVRVSYYLANRKAVVCENYPELKIEDVGLNR
jgi:hypothetical protein